MTRAHPPCNNNGAVVKPTSDSVELLEHDYQWIRGGDGVENDTKCGHFTKIDLRVHVIHRIHEMIDNVENVLIFLFSKKNLR